MKRLILPGDEEFDLTLGTALPPNWEESAAKFSGEYSFVASSETGLLRPVSAAELEEYLEGGEYRERLINSEQWELLEDLDF